MIKNNDYNLSVVFCATNESHSLMSTYSKIRCCNCAEEYIFVLSQNASDACVATVKNICNNADCRYFFQSSSGLGMAIREAIDDAKGSHIVVWPADDGMDTSSFSEMVRISKENPEKIVTVSRWLAKDGFQNYGRIRKGINYISQKVFALLYKADLTDFTNPTQIAPLKIYREINWQGVDWDFIPEFIFKPLRLGCDFIEVPCKSLSRKEGASNSSFLKLARYYMIIYKIFFMSIDEITKGRN